METKTIELRDKGTFLPALLVRLDPTNGADNYLLRRAGFGESADDQGRYVLLVKLEGSEAAYDPYDWGPTRRTLFVAHEYAIGNFDAIESGQVVDVEYILGETEEPKQSESLTSLF